MTPLWFSKHQWLLPSAIISFFNFTLDRNSSTLQDNKLKTEINALRTSITASSYKFRLIVILVADDHGTEIGSSDRIANIRRGTNLDSKSLFFLPRGPSDMELRKFVGMVLSSIQPTCMEYYRELSKHARKKRSRGSIPPPTAPPTTGTSQTLSSQGWNVRYETKLGFFAESRQEMDAAGQSYEAAYEYLVDGDVFEGIASWSPRFDEGRLLADILAIRILRCLLWTGQTTSAVQSWTNHRYRMQEIIDKKGKGTSTYGWQAWEARWSVVMAELIERVDVPIFHVPEHPKATEQTKYEVPDIYAIPEKAFANEPRLPPWDLLHHEGYWLERAVHRTQLRRRLALTMPKEDRSVPGQSPASAIASRTHLYDSYLCPEPHFEYALPGNDSFDHGALLVNILQKSAHHFSLRHQHRAVQRAQHVMAMEHTKYRRWEEAMAIVKPLWHNLTWRHSGWWQLVEEVSWTMRACARNLDDGESLVAVEWELLSDCMSTTPRIRKVDADFILALPARPNWNYNLLNCLDGLEIDKPVVVIEFDNLAPCSEFERQL